MHCVHGPVCREYLLHALVMLAFFVDPFGQVLCVLTVLCGCISGCLLDVLSLESRAINSQEQLSATEGQEFGDTP